MITPKILVVDDYENLRKLVAGFLARLGYKCKPEMAELPSLRVSSHE